jgi:iron(III) transport system ATP-binding protein
MTPLLQLESVQKRYDRTAVLQDIRFSVQKGEFVLLVGGSGSGKTTLLRIVGGLEGASAGIVTLRGRVVDDPARGLHVSPEQRGLGMVFQDYALWPHVTCLENVALALPPRTPIRERAALALLEQMGVAAYADVRPGKLSGGQQQRVGLARALAPRPDLLLLDEPLSNLDIELRDRLRLEIRSLAQEYGTTALFVSHDPLDAWRLGDRVLVLERGVLVQAGTPQDLYKMPRTPRVARFVGAEGGFPVELVGDSQRLGFQIDGYFQPGTVINARIGQAARAYVRPTGVLPGTEGFAATLVHAGFESGVWRAYWRLPGIAGAICSITSEPPSAEATRLRCDPDQLFIYGEETTSHVV